MGLVKLQTGTANRAKREKRRRMKLIGQRAVQTSRHKQTRCISVQYEAKMIGGENRSGAAFLAVSTGSAEPGHLQPVMG
jgi:hypothetical protein